MAYTPSHNKIVPCRFGPHVRSRPAVAAALPRTSPQSVRHGYTPHQQSGQNPFLALCLSGLIGGGSQGRPSLTSPLQVEAIRSWTEAVRQPNVSIDTCLYVELYKRPTKVAPVLQKLPNRLACIHRDEKVHAPAYAQDDSLRLLQLLRIGPLCVHRPK